MKTLAELESIDAGEAGNACRAMHGRLKDGHKALSDAVHFVLDTNRHDPNAVAAGGVLYLKLAGAVLTGWQMARALVVAVRKRNRDPDFYGAKIATAHFFADYILPQAPALAASILSAKDGEASLALAENDF